MTSAQLVRLRDLGEWTGGNTPSKANPAYWTGGTILWVSPKDMKVDEITSSEDRVTENALNEGRVSLVPEGSVLLVTRSGILAHTLPVAVTRVPVTINQDLKALTPRTGVMPKYVAHAVRGAARRILKQCSKHGTTVASIETKALLDFEIPLVDIDKQRRIVAEIEKQFSRLDEAVANLKRVKANLNRYKAAVLRTATVGSSSAVTPKANLPPGWWWSTCGDVIEAIEAGASFKCLERPPQGDEVGVLKVSSVTWGTFDENESKTCVDPSRIKESLFVRSGDFLFSRANTIDLVGACVIVGCISKRLMLSDKILRFRLRPTVSPEWLLICLRSQLGRAEIESLATGNQESMRNIGQDRIRQIRLPLPPQAEQHRIVAEVDRRLSIVREVEAEVDANLKRAQALRQAVLARAFSGPVESAAAA